MAMQQSQRPPQQGQQQQKPPQGQQGQKPAEEGFSLRKHLEARIPYIAEMASGSIDPKKVVATTLLMVQKKGNDALAKAAWDNPQSLLLALLQLTELGLEADGVEAALIPYAGEVTAQTMFQGLVKLLYGSGMVKDVYADVVYANEVAVGRFRYQKGSKPYIHHEPLLKDRGEPIAAYAVMHLMTGGAVLDVMTAEEIEKAKASSKTATKSDSPWQKWPMEMWKKTALKRLSKVGPKSESLRKALALDARDYVDGELVNEEAGPRGGVAQLQNIVSRGLPAASPKERIETPVHQKQTVGARNGPPGDEPPPVGDPLPPSDDEDEPPADATEELRGVDGKPL